MSNRKLISAAFFSFLLAVVLWWMLHSSGRVPQKNQTVSSATPAQVTAADVKQVQSASNDSKSAKELERINMQKLHEREEATREAFEAKIDFFGKVIDERGQPISGAITSYIVSTRSLTGNPTQLGPKTDSEGRFSITDKRGPRLAVMVEHPNYYKTDLHGRFFTYGGPVAEGSPKIPTADNPAIFVLQSKGKAESLICHSIETHIPIDGMALNLDLRKGVVGTGGESIILNLMSDGNKLPLNQYYPFDWSLKIQVPGGGIQERTNRFQFQAPSEGYQSEISISKAASLPREEWKGEFQKEFFILLPSGTYARIQIRVVAKKGSCEIESFLNPNPSSRNLEYDPNKQAPAQ
jgi:hypothetical protein